MKYTIILFFFTLLSCKQSIDYSGSWKSAGDNFENTLTLEKVEGKQDRYKFSFNGWRISYDVLAKQNIKFLGGMNDEVFVIEVKENQAVYSDDGREFSEEFPLYNEGEERCKLYFELTNNKIIVKTESCHFIYGGKGVLFDGVYKKLNLSDN
jgi:hypothetical protein